MQDNSNMFYAFFDEIPMAIFIVDDDVKIIHLNNEAKRLLGSNTIIYHKRGGEILRCVHSKETSLGCGHSSSCKDCVLRSSVNEAVKGAKTYRKQTILKLELNGQEEIFHALITTSPFKSEDKQYYTLIIENVSELIRLKDIIPICCNCKKIRNDENYWIAVEQYFHHHTDVDFSHSICPECTDLLYPELKEIRANKKQRLMQENQ